MAEIMRSKFDSVSGCSNVFSKLAQKVLHVVVIYPPASQAPAGAPTTSNSVFCFDFYSGQIFINLLPTPGLFFGLQRFRTPCELRCMERRILGFLIRFWCKHNCYEFHEA